MRSDLIRHSWARGLACALLLCLCVPLWAQNDPAPVARQYFDFLHKTIGAVRADMPQISDAGERAAKLFLEDKNIGVRGSTGLGEELGGRAGGVMVYRSTKDTPDAAILYAFGVATRKEPDPAAVLTRELADAKALADGGALVIGIASKAQLEALGKLDEARGICAILLDNHCPAGDGLFRSKEQKAIVPTFTTANAIVAWTWCVEMVAACTRQGKMPAMYQSVFVAGARARNSALGGKRFQEDLKIAAFPAGHLGDAWLTGIEDLLHKVETASWPALVQTSERAAQAVRDGGRALVYASGHYPPYQHGGQLAVDPGPFIQLNVSAKKHPEEDLGPKDFVLAIGYCTPPGDTVMFGDPEYMRKAGRGVSWVVTDFLTKPEDLRANELLINQHWGEGDAIVTVPGYDVKIAPPSGVIGLAIMWGVVAETQARLAAP